MGTSSLRDHIATIISPHMAEGSPGEVADLVLLALASTPIDEIQMARVEALNA